MSEMPSAVKTEDDVMSPTKNDNILKMRAMEQPQITKKQ
jgi:hypothetical protein